MARSAGADAGSLTGPTLAVARRLVALGFLVSGSADVHPRASGTVPPSTGATIRNWPMSRKELEAQQNTGVQS